MFDQHKTKQVSKISLELKELHVPAIKIMYNNENKP